RDVTDVAAVLVAAHDLVGIRNIGSVDRADISRSGMEPREVGFMRPERRPCDQARRLKKTDEGWRVGRMPCHAEGTGYPAPPAAQPSPTPVVERHEAPRLAVDPGPAPSADVAPRTLLVGHPGRLDRRIPDRAILRHLAPRAVSRQIAAARHRQHDCRRRYTLRNRGLVERRCVTHEIIRRQGVDPAGEPLGPFLGGLSLRGPGRFSPAGPAPSGYLLAFRA